MKKIIIKYGFLFGALFSAFITGCASSVPETVSITEEVSVEDVQETVAEEEPDEAEGMIHDINIIRTTLADSLLCGRYDKAPFEKLIEDVKNGEVDRVECYYRVSDIFSDYDVLHLYLMPNSSLEEEIIADFFPISIHEFEGDYYIVSILEQYQEYMGKKIVSMGNVSISQVVDRLAEICSIETESAKKGVVEADNRGIFSVAKPTLEYCGLVDDNGNLCVEVENEDGSTVSFTLSAIPYFEEHSFSTLKDEWTEYEVNYSSGVNYCFHGDEENGIMYFEYFRCQEQEVTFENCFTEMMEEIEKSGNYNTIIFNVKDNGGGNRMLAREMLIKYQDEIAPLRKYVVIGNGTASAGQHFIEDCLELFPEIKIYGEETAQAIVNFTEVKEINLDSLGVVFTYPSLIDSVPHLEQRADDKKKGVLPDVHVVQTYDDYINGIDTVYAKILEDIDREN